MRLNLYCLFIFLSLASSQLIRAEGAELRSEDIGKDDVSPKILHPWTVRGGLHFPLALDLGAGFAWDKKNRIEIEGIDQSDETIFSSVQDQQDFKVESVSVLLKHFVYKGLYLTLGPALQRMRSEADTHYDLTKNGGVNFTGLRLALYASAGIEWNVGSKVFMGTEFAGAFLPLAYRSFRFETRNRRFTDEQKEEYIDSMKKPMSMFGRYYVGLRF